jgi:outer membrane protein TolC
LILSFNPKKVKAMVSKKVAQFAGVVCVSLMCAACTIPSLVKRTENKGVPSAYVNSSDSVNAAKVKWRDFFTDPDLQVLIDTALKNNQELNILLQEIAVARNEVRARKGQYLPFVNIQGGAGLQKDGRYTRTGAIDANTEIEPGKRFPDPLPDYLAAANISWEVDIWRKLRNAKQSAVYSYLATAEGKNFMVTRLIT